MRRSPLFRLALPLMSVVATSACANPVHDNEVAALGSEASGVSPGPTHRPGQPCLTCHGGEGPAKEQFALAGTVFQIPSALVGMNGVTVNVTDVNKAAGSATTNSAGNFYIVSSSYAPTYPVDVALVDGKTTNQMLTHIGRDGSCASCHFDPEGPTTPGHVYLAGSLGDLPQEVSQ